MTAQQGRYERARYFRENTGTFGLGIGWERLHGGGKAFYVRLGRHHHEWKWDRR